MKTKSYNMEPLFQLVDRLLFRFRWKIQKSNIAVVKYFIYIFSVQLLIYFLFYLQSIFWPQVWGISIWSLDAAIPTIITTTGMIFTIIVLFAINPRKTQFGNEFINLLIDEVNLLKPTEEIIIISPNINIGTTTYKWLLRSLIDAITRAKSRSAKISFISNSLDKGYLDSFQGKADLKIGDYIKFYADGNSNNSKMLTYLYELYDMHGIAKEEYAKTIDYLKELIQCVQIISPATNILDKRIVGFLSNNKFYLGKYHPDSYNNKQITVKGEVIDTPETVQMLREYFIKDL